MKLESNLWKLKIIYMIEDFILVISFITIFWLNKGLTMTEVFLLQSIFALFVLILEVPSGYFADKFGRKKAMIIGSIFTFLGFLYYCFAGSFLQFVFIEALLAVGVSFCSGSNSAMLYDTLLSLNREKEYHKTESRYFAVTGYSCAIATIMGSFLAEKYMQEAFYLQAFVFIFPIFLSISLVEPKLHKEAGTAKINFNKILHYSYRHQEIKWLIFYSGFLASSTLAIVWYSQPFMKYIGIPIAFFGVIWALLSFLRGVFSNLSPQLEKFLGRKKILFILVISPFIGYLGLGIFQNSIWAVVFFICFQFSFAVSTPVIKNYINNLVESNMRATVLSLQSMMQRLIFTITGPFLGWILDLYSFRVAFVFSAFFFFLSGLLCLLILKKHRVI